MSLKTYISILLGPLSFFLILNVDMPGLAAEPKAILGAAVWMAIWWVSEAVPLAVTALLPILLFPLSGALGMKETTAPYSHPYIFLYLGGFFIAIAIEKWGLHKRIALNIINWIGTNVKNIILGFMVGTAFLSMWISNTAAAVMLLPVGLAITKQLKDNPETDEDENAIFGKALMLAIAYSASIGGIATLIGTPPNLVLAGVMEESFDITISFSDWFMFGFPLSVVLLVICWFYLTHIAFRFKQKNFPGGKREVKRQLKILGNINFNEKKVLVVFVATASAWILKSLVLEKFIPGIDDTIIAIAGGSILFLIPTGTGNERLLIWSDIGKIPWDIILLFGGGMSLAIGFERTGLAEWIGGQFTSLRGMHLIWLLLVIVISVNFLTEFTSNLATTAMLLPILISVAVITEVHPFLLLVGATVAASCAFMLPVATPPNAVVFGSGYLKISDMVKVGIGLNIISIILVTLAVYFILPVIWGRYLGYL